MDYSSSGPHMMTGVGGYRYHDHRGLSQELAHEDAEITATEYANNRYAKMRVVPEAGRIYHVVPFAQKEQAKAEGMRWDAGAKKWYHTSASKSEFSAWSKA